MCKTYAKLKFKFEVEISIFTSVGWELLIVNEMKQPLWIYPYKYKNGKVDREEGWLAGGSQKIIWKMFSVTI